MYITNKQRQKAFAMMRDMANHAGITSEAHYYLFHKLQFSEIMDYPEGQVFSMATDKCTQREYQVFIDYLAEEWFASGVQSDHSPQIYFDDIERYMAICLKKRICAITNRPNADIHHVDRIGMGTDRHKVDHSKYRRMTLCREMHIICHTMGQEEFNEMYHVCGIYSNAWNGEKDVVDHHVKKGGEIEDLENLLDAE